LLAKFLPTYGRITTINRLPAIKAIQFLQPMSQTDPFLRLVAHPLKFRLFLLAKLPAAFFSGVRVKSANGESCTATVPFKWFSQNPFRSTYFACLAMAAEMSTGILAMAHLHRRKPAVSMLVLKVEGQFLKKATGRTAFTCNDGGSIRQAIEESIATGEGRTITAHSVGQNAAGETVAEFWVTWSFKAKG
jgi:hypothetical protein